MKSLVLALALIGVSTISSEAKSNSLSVQPIDNDDGKYLSGAGCYWGPVDAPNKSILLFDEANGPAWINVNGQVEQLKIVGTTEQEKDKKGVVHLRRTFSSDKIAVEVNDVETFCGEGGCSYDSEIQVKKGKAAVKLKAKGGCGC